MDFISRFYNIMNQYHISFRFIMHVELYILVYSLLVSLVFLCFIEMRCKTKVSFIIE